MWKFAYRGGVHHGDVIQKISENGVFEAIRFKCEHCDAEHVWVRDIKKDREYIFFKVKPVVKLKIRSKVYEI